jgi:hypothetical protein
MKNIPVYFPMTYLSAAMESNLAACFRQTAVYRPSNRKLPETMQAAMDADRLVVHTPVEAESARLIELMEAYYGWAKDNKGVDLSIFKGNETRIPFYGDTSISRIRQNIREMDSESKKEQVADPVFKARLFLEMAQELDRQNQALERSLDDVRDKENSMLADLLGDAADHRGIAASSTAGSTTDPGAYMTGTRLQAWWRLVREGAAPGNLLVTNSRAVIEYLVEKCPDLKKTDRVFKLPRRQPGAQEPAAWQDRFFEYLEQLTCPTEAGDGPVDIPGVKPGEAVVGLSFYHLEKTDTAGFFNSLDGSVDAMPARGPGENLVICLVADEGAHF